METVILNTLGVFTVFMTVLWGIGMRMLYSEIAAQAQKIDVGDRELVLTEQIKQEIYDLMSIALEDVVGNIQMPTAMDHLAGFASTWLQRKMMPDISAIQGIPGNIIEEVGNSVMYGQTEQQEENNPSQ